MITNIIGEYLRYLHQMQNQAKINAKVVEITFRWWRYYLHRQQISPPKEQQNQAHFEKDGDVGDSGDIFHTRWMGGHDFFLL